MGSPGAGLVGGPSPQRIEGRMNEDGLRRIEVAVVGSSDRSLWLRLFAKEGCIPVGGAEAPVWILCGTGAVDKHMGPGWRNQVTALRKWPGDKKATRRSSWEPYCVRSPRKFAHVDTPEDARYRWYVTCLHPEAVRKSRWTKSPSLTAAVRWSIHLHDGGLPERGGRALNLPKEW